MTTVGYGDYYPTTTIGYLIGIMCAITGKDIKRTVIDTDEIMILNNEGYSVSSIIIVLMCMYVYLLILGKKSL